MTLTLQIENYDVLEDGGPVYFTVNQGGFQAGRGSGMDWVLPDPSRHISGRHLEITYTDGAYWLTDVSTNGTFLKGQRYRLEGPHQLKSGDRFQVGHYIIVVHFDGGAPAPDAYAPAPVADSDNPWDIGGLAAEPIDPLPRPSEHLREDFADDFIANPMPTAPVSAPLPPSSEPEPEPASQLAFTPQINAIPAPVTPESSPAENVLPAPVPAAAQPDFFKAFCEGAGLSAEAYANIDSDALALELGQSLRITAEEVMILLRNRASAKQFTKGGERTMRRAADNNPLKFLPDVDQAIEAMFLKPRAGFLTGKDGFSEALKDIRLHQAAVFAAIQPALTKLLNDLAPEAILDSAEGGILKTGKRSKAWDTYVERWDAKTHPHENGILDEFLSHFAEAYAEMTKNSHD